MADLQSFAQLFAQVYRDFKLAGVPASGANEPEKSAIRAIGAALDLAIAAASVGDLGQAIALLQPIADEATAARNATEAAMASLVVTDHIGRPEATTSGAHAATATFAMAAPAPHRGASQGVVRRVRARSTSAGSKTIMAKVFDLIDGALVQSGPDHPFIVSGGGETTADLNFAILPGQYLGYYTPAKGVDYIVGAPGDGGGYWSGGANNVGTVNASGAPTTNIQLQIGFDIEWQAVTPPRLDAAEARIAANEAAIAPTAVLVDAMIERETQGRPTITPTANARANVGTYVPAPPLRHGGRAEKLRFRNLIVSGRPVTVYLRRFTVTNGDCTPVPGSLWTPVVVAAGSSEVALNLPVAAGERIAVSVPVGVLAYQLTADDDGGYYRTATERSDGFSAAHTAGVQLQLGVDVHYSGVSTNQLQATEVAVSALGAEVDQVTASMTAKPKALASHGYNGLDWVASSGFLGWAYGFDIGVDLAAGEPVDAVSVRMQPSAGAATLRTALYKRSTSSAGINNAPGVGGEAPLAVSSMSLAASGATIGAFSDVFVPLPVSINGASGETYIVAHEWLDESGARVASGYGRADPGGLSEQRGRGWYRDPDWKTVSTSGALSWTLKGSRYTITDLDERVAVLEAVGGAGADLMLAVYPTVTITGFAVKVGGRLRQNATDYPLNALLTLPPAATGKARMDRIVVNRLTRAVTVVAGVERNANLDAIEWMGSVPPEGVLIATALVTNAAVYAALNAGFRHQVKLGREGEYSAHVARNRHLIRKTIAKATRGQALKLGIYGDSISAFQNVSGAANIPFTANGERRDRPQMYFGGSYPSDTMAKIPLFDFGDGAGQVHCKQGWGWSVKAALDALAGSEVVGYLNYGIGGTTSAASQYNGLYPDRIAQPLAASLDLILIAFGMNERGSTVTYANLVNMVQKFQAVGTEVALMGCPRPHSANDVAAWRYTEDAIEAAARDAGAAYVSTAMIADDRNLGALGAPAQALGATNIPTAGNHPGIYELEQYGKAAVSQLGL